MKIRLYVSLSLLIMLVSFGCGGSAEIEMSQAQDAMNRAKTYDADSLASGDFQKAQIAWDHAQAAEKEGKTDSAKVLFTSAKIFFDKAADIAKSRREALSREWERMEGMISKNFGQVKFDLSSSALSPEQKSRVTALVSEIEGENAAIDKLVANRDLSEAVARAKDVQTKIYHAQLILAGRKIK